MFGTPKAGISGKNSHPSKTVKISFEMVN